MENERLCETVLNTETVLEQEDSSDKTVLMDGENDETILESYGVKGEGADFLNPGQTIAENYVVLNRMESRGAQASIYRVRREGRQCIIKMYNNNYEPSSEFIELLKGHKCPYIAQLYDYGYEKGHYYEIYEYYENGTLGRKGKCSTTFIKDIVVPNLNEGLHFLHTLGKNGIVHGDVKPDNIFISNDETNVLLGDFGISAYLNRKGRVIGEMKGTPEYAPRTLSFFGKATKSAAYDYGSLGLLLIKLATGYSIFEGLDTTAITKKWEEGIRVPHNIEDRLKRLIAGLLIEDEVKRFGYEEVARWCEGEFVQSVNNSLYTKEDFVEEREREPLVFGIVGERIITVSTLEELSKAIENNWEIAKKQIRKPMFFDFIDQFDTVLEKKVKQLCETEDLDIALFYVLCKIKKNSNLVYKGVNYGSAVEFIDALNDSVTREHNEIIEQGLFEFYLKENGAEPDLIESVKNAVEKAKGHPELLSQMIYYSFHREKIFKLNGQIITSQRELIRQIGGMQIEEIESLVNDKKFLAWLYSMGYKDAVMKILDL